MLTTDMWRTRRVADWIPRRRVAGWSLLGLSASIVEFVLLRGLYEALGLPLPVASAVAAEVMIMVKFLLNDRYVFGHAWPTFRRLVRYHGASAGALIVYWLVINAVSVLGGEPYVAGFVIGTAAAFTWSLLTNFFWVWATAPSDGAR